MKTRITIMTVLLLFLVDCTDKSQSQKYSLMKQENSKLIAQCKYVIKDQQDKIDTLQNYLENFVSFNLRSIDMSRLGDDIKDAVGVQKNAEMLEISLMLVDSCAIILEKAYSKSFYWNRKRVIYKCTKSLNILNNANSTITGGLPVKGYLNKYLPLIMQ